MRLVGLQLDYVEIDRIIACTKGPDHSDFEAETLKSIKEEGFFNPLTTNIRIKGYGYDPNSHYLSLGNHRYWIARAADITHLWCISRVWNTLMIGEKEPSAEDFINVIPPIRVKKEPPWDIRDFEIVLNPEGVFNVNGVARQEVSVGRFTGRLLMEPIQKVNPDYVLKLTLKNKVKSILE